MATENFTCIGKGHGAPALPATLEQWREARRQEWLGEMCRRIEQGEVALKAKLPVWTPRCAAFRNNHRAEKDAERPLARLMLDIDEKGRTDEIMARMEKRSSCSSSSYPSDTDGRWIGGMRVLMVEESVRRGTHILIELPEGTTAEEAQTRASEALGIACDPAVKNVAGCIYLVADDHTRFIDEERIARAEELKQNAHCDSHPAAPTTASDYGVGYEEIVEALAEQLGGVAAHGSRNSFIYVMACHMRYVCGDDERLIASVVPTYGEDDEKARATIASACRRAQPPTMPKVVRTAIDIARKRARFERMAEEGKAAVFGSVPPPMPKRLPRLIGLLTSKVPAAYKPAVAAAVFPALGCHLHGVRFRYIDGVVREPSFMSVLVAPPSVGKGYVNAPIDHIMANIRVRDEQNRERERQFKIECSTRGANKEKPERPADLLVQWLMADMTNAALVQRLIDAERAGEYSLYARMDELEQLSRIASTGGSKPTDVIRLAFDHSLYGQERVGRESVSGTPALRWNWNASTTPQNIVEYFGLRSLQNGTLTRLNLSTIVRSDEVAEVPRIGEYDAKFDEALRPFIVRLQNAHGTIAEKKAERLTMQMVGENDKIAALTADENFLTFSYRACVIAFMKAMVLFIAEGKWSKQIEDFVRWSEQYDMWCKMTFFGELMEKNDRRARERRPGPQNMLELLGDPFTKADLELLMQRLGKPTANAASVLRKWKHRGFIGEEDGRFRKAEPFGN